MAKIRQAYTGYRKLKTLFYAHQLYSFTHFWFRFLEWQVVESRKKAPIRLPVLFSGIADPKPLKGAKVRMNPKVTNFFEKI